MAGWSPRRVRGRRAYLFGTPEQATSSPADRSAVGAEDAVARVAQPGADVAVAVELAVERGGDDRDLRMGLAQGRDALRRGHEADHVDAPRARALEARDGLRRAAACGQHRVDDEDLGLLHAGGDVLVVAD